MTVDARYGWRRDGLDPRDYRWSMPKVAALPPSVDLRSGCPPIYNQGALGSCTANALAAAFDFERKRQGLPLVSPSRLFLYFNERWIEGTITSDAGAAIRDGIKALAKIGICPESEWPYEVSQFATLPPFACYVAAQQDRAVSYTRLGQDIVQIKTTLAEGFPFVFGFAVFEAFESAAVAENGLVPMPSPTDRPLGGHAVMAVGYDDTKNSLLVRNSWGDGWGEAGHFWLPYDYALSSDLAADFWSIKLVTAD